MTTFQPFHHFVLIQRIQGKQKSDGGIYIPDQAQEKPQMGKVIGFGPQAKVAESDRDLKLDIGDTVIFGKYVGSEIELDGKPFLLIRSEDIFGRLEV